MSASVFAFLGQVKERGAQLPEPLAAALLLAAVRLSEKNAQAVRPDLLVVDEDGGLTLRKGAPDREGPYSAPELAGDKVSSRDPRVLVYAAGALGYELSTLEAPHPGATTAGVLGPVIQKALAADRKDRYRNLEEMARAIEELQKRPTNDEERLILTAVVQSTAAPKTLAKLPTRKMRPFDALDPKDAPDRAETGPPEPASNQATAHGWDPHDRTPRVVFPKNLATPAKEPAPGPTHVQDAAEPKPGRAEAVRVHASAPAARDAALDALRELSGQIEADRKARAEELARVERKLESLATLADRVDALENRSPAGPVPHGGRQGIRHLLAERRFAEAERALRTAPEDDASMQMLLGVALAGQADADGSRAARAEAALRRAAELDTAWAHPKALLGALLIREGRRAEALPLLHAALAIDPENPEARAALGRASRRWSMWPAAALGAAAGAAAAVAIVASLKAPLAVPALPSPIAQVPAAAPVHAPGSEASAIGTGMPVALALPLPVPPATTPASPEAPAARPERATRPRKAVAVAPGRSEALAEAAKGEKALRAFDTASALAAFEAALRLDPALPSAHRGMGMVRVLQGKDAEAKSEYRRYLELARDAPDREQIQRLLAR